MKTLHLLVAATCGLALSACVVEAPNNTGGAATADIAQSDAERACRNALVDFHSVNDVRVVSSEPYQGGGRYVRASVRAGSNGQREIWQCIAYSNGGAGELQYLSADNSGAAPPPSGGTGRPAVGSEYDLSEFEGARAGQAEGGIRALGYEAVRSEGLTTYWFNRSTGACAQITTSNGRYSSVNMLPAQDC